MARTAASTSSTATAQSTAKRAAKNPGTVYLIHFERPYKAKTGAMKKQAQHYIGWAKNLEARIAEHRASRGARLIEVINADGIHWDVVQTWTGDRKLERQLKNRKKSRCFCPACKAALQTVTTPMTDAMTAMEA